MSTSILTSPSLRVFINNKVYGKVTSFSHTVDRGLRTRRGVDELLPAEIVEGPVTVRGQMDVIRLRYDAGLEGGGLVALPGRIPLEKYISIRVIDRRSDTVVFQADQARVLAYNFVVRPRDRVHLSLSFEAIGYTNEFGSSIL